jgi:hypothetical protein
MNRDLVETIQYEELTIQDPRESSFTLERIDKEAVEFLESLSVQSFHNGSRSQMNILPSAGIEDKVATSGAQWHLQTRSGPRIVEEVGYLCDKWQPRMVREGTYGMLVKSVS